MGWSGVKKWVDLKSVKFLDNVSDKVAKSSLSVHKNGKEEHSQSPAIM